MEAKYVDERNIQMLIYLMKKHGVRQVIASPGTTNITFVGSIQDDPFFKVYSSVDERSAAYMACGLAAESGEPVALSCTGATASRNYIPGLTEAFYRKLPVLAITSTQHTGRVGQNVAQVIDRSSPLNDIVVLSVQVPSVHDAEDEYDASIKLNNALLALRRNGGAPVHINIATKYSNNFNVEQLPPAQTTFRMGYADALPSVPRGKVGIYAGAHKPWTDDLTSAVDAFCKKYNGVVLCDQTSNYHGENAVLAPVVCQQDLYWSKCRNMDLLVDIGDVSGGYFSVKSKNVWRVNPDGEIRGRGLAVSQVFQMREIDFFRSYLANEGVAKVYTGPLETTSEEDLKSAFHEEWAAEDARLREKIPELPFSNVWIAQQCASKVPAGSELHLGILNSLRSWNMFAVDSSVEKYSNVGGFGIDGDVSSLIGASLFDPSKLYFGVVGDLAFFYDLNSIGNRHVGKNLRLMMVNNGRGTEFLNYNHMGKIIFGQEADRYISAAGHFGSKSPDLVRHFATDLGFKYMSASDKSELESCAEEFFSPDMGNAPILLEIFTDSQDESDAIEMMHNLDKGSKTIAKKAVKRVVGDEGVKRIKKLMGR